MFLSIFFQFFWSTVSKAFEKSMKTPSVNCLSLKELEIRLGSCNIACFVYTESQTVFTIKTHFQLKSNKSDKK